ncbi:hypothetical protein [Mesorhizobium sp.]|uniref:hypothetical protein n=1 Tax=Mesorhizobium sp. TaxID=1871066 RepID=UPI000FEA0CDA|nr:hypothetical protein [Mesorhizobium sp.]RWJ43113.1 MAG: hypothetical protein EOR31_22445 [Mesorhizobium sp.]
MKHLLEIGCREHAFGARRDNVSRAAADRLEDELEPWAVSGVALEYGLRALADLLSWQETMRSQFRQEQLHLMFCSVVTGFQLLAELSLFCFLELNDAGRCSTGSAGAASGAPLRSPAELPAFRSPRQRDGA